MNKRLFVILVVLMSLSLVGIIFVQIFWIKQSVEDKEEQFSHTVSDGLNDVADKIASRETRNYFDRYMNLKDSIGELKNSSISNFFFIDRDLNSNEIRLYQHGILEEDYNIPSTFFDNGNEDNDLTTIKNYTSKRSTTIFKENIGLDGKQYELNAVQKFEKIGGLTEIVKAQMEDVFSEYAKMVPIHRRVSKQEIELLLDREFKNRELNVDFEYGIYSRGLPTKVKSKKFKYSNKNIYQSPIFKDLEGNSNFSLLVSFPKKKRFLVQSIIGMAGLSLLFTLIIVVAYAGAIYQLIQQKQISEIKNGFY